MHVQEISTWAARALSNATQYWFVELVNCFYCKLHHAHHRHNSAAKGINDGRARDSRRAPHATGTHFTPRKTLGRTHLIFPADFPIIFSRIFPPANLAARQTNENGTRNENEQQNGLMYERLELETYAISHR